MLLTPPSNFASTTLPLTPSHLPLYMGHARYDAYRVWDANQGNPVGENATLAFGTDGNLLLADADGRVAWQTNIANKDVVGFELLQNGNLVLHRSTQRAVLFGKALITQRTLYWWAKL